MKELARLVCPRCRGVTLFHAEVLEELFGSERVGQDHVSYLVSCRHCRAPGTLIVRHRPGRNGTTDGRGHGGANGAAPGPAEKSS